MSECRRFKDLLEKFVAGEHAPSDPDALRDHAKGCTDCRRVIELHEELRRAADELPEPSEAHFREMRAAVRRRIPRGEHGRATREVVRGGFLRALWSRPSARPALAFVLAIAFLVGGFVLGRLSVPEPGFDEELMVEAISRQASLEKGLAGYWDSPFVYSNVSFRPRNGRVELSFDVARHIDVETTADSPLLREVVLHAMLDPAEMGSRLDALELAPGTMDGKLREVLVFTLLNDPSMPVRLSALSILRGHASDSSVRDALLTTIGQDPSVHVRFLALECLANQSVEPETIRRAVGESPDEAGRAVLERANELF